MPQLNIENSREGEDKSKANVVLSYKTDYKPLRSKLSKLEVIENLLNDLTSIKTWSQSATTIVKGLCFIAIGGFIVLVANHKYFKEDCKLPPYLQKNLDYIEDRADYEDTATLNWIATIPIAIGSTMVVYGAIRWK